MPRWRLTRLRISPSGFALPSSRARIIDNEKSRRPKTSPDRNIKHEIKIHLRVQILPDSNFHVRSFDGNRRCSIDWASYRFQGPEPWEEFGC
jgi:hypothetical protein